jgi:thioredoxin
VKKVSFEEFNSVLLNEPYVLVDFYAEWCEPCKTLDGILKEVSNLMDDKIYIQKINMDFSLEISQAYKVLSVPVLIFFKNGEPVWRMNGFMTAFELIKTLEKFY